jgi:hypothetical protein
MILTVSTQRFDGTQRVGAAHMSGPVCGDQPLCAVEWLCGVERVCGVRGQTRRRTLAMIEVAASQMIAGIR